MGFGDLTKALALFPVSMDPIVIEFQWTAPDGAAFELGSPHAGTNSLDDQAALKFSDRTDDDHDGPAQRSSGVDLLSKTDELDLQPI